MTRFPLIADKKDSFAFNVRLICLLVIGAVEFLLMTKGADIYEDLLQLMRMGIVGSLVIFAGVSLWRNPRCMLQKDVALGVLTVAWFLILEILRRRDHTFGQSIPLFLPVYLIALPFAAATEDAHCQTGLRAAAGIYLAAAAYLMVLSIDLFVMDDLSATVNRLVFWKGERMQVVHHPNILARILMIAICFSLGFTERAKGFLARGLLWGFTVLMFAGLAMTNSRACALVTCLLLGGNMFFRIWKGGSKGLIPALAAAAVTAAAAFLIYNGLFGWNSERLLNLVPESGSLTGAATQLAPQGSWTADLPTLNSRTLIWAEALDKIRNDPWILLRGDVDTKIVLDHFVAKHSHNAWLEALLRLGLPGLLLSLIFSWRAGWASLRVLCHTETGIWKKNIAMLALAMMVTSILEPFLFVTTDETHFFDFIFFLCLGYLTLWSRELKEQG